MNGMLPNEAHMNYILSLADISQGDIEHAGAKAATLGELARAGFPVPDGFVLTTDAFDRLLAEGALGPDISPQDVIAATLPADVVEALLAAADALGDFPLAVRSSGMVEDLPGASFAGQYDTALDVRGAGALVAAVQRVFASAFSPRVAVYSAAHCQRGGRMAVLVQRQVEASAAGVAFTANPITGDRSEVVISAVQGSGERLVSGQATPDEWIVRDQEAVCRVAPEGAITADQALSVARLARHVEAHFGGTPQDIEWALVGDEFLLLQARPITALPAPVVWKAPLPGAWARHVRLGEWLGDAVTPLFESWGLPLLEERMFANYRQIAGVPAPQPRHVVVNGWYFCSLGFLPSSTTTMLWRLLRYALPKALIQPRRAAMMMPFTARFGVELFVCEWREILLPRYQVLVQQNASRVDQLNAPDLVHLVEELAGVAGDYFTSITLVAGFAWKAEMPLAAFYRKYLFPRIGGSYQQLLCGLSDVSSVSASHAVACLDWFHPTLGEQNASRFTGSDLSARVKLSAAEKERLQAEAQARSALAHEPKLLARFEKLLATAQRFGQIREEQASWFTLGWPIMRRALLRLGEILMEHDILPAAEDMFFLTRTELLAALTESSSVRSLTSEVTERRKLWQRQCRLTPPLVLGEMTPMIKRIFDSSTNLLRQERAPSGGNVLTGLPASPGRASGPARIIHTSEEFDHLQPGDVLIAPVTTPAWTPLFARASAIVTDSGSPLAHASLAAREYGIPTVVGTGNATAHLRDGQRVLVDGNSGLVEVQS